MSKKVLLCSWGQLEGAYSNLGDILIFETQINILRQYYKNIEIYAISSTPIETNQKYGIQSVSPFSILGFFKFLNFICNADLVIIGGGELIQDKSSKLYLTFNYFPIILSKIFKRKVITLGVGANNKDELSNFGKFLTKRIISCINSSSVREEISYRHMVNLGFKTENLLLTSDIVFLRNEFKNHVKIHTNDKISLPINKYIVIALRDITGRKSGILPRSIRRSLFSNFHKDNNDFSEFLNTIADAINKIISIHNFEIVLWPTYFGKNFSSKDDSISKSLYNKISDKNRITMINNPLSYSQIIYLLKNAEMLMGTPLHSLIMATIANCPFLALNYAEKGLKFIDQIDYPKEFSIDLGRLNTMKEVKFQDITKKINSIIKEKNIIKLRLNENLKNLIELSKNNLILLNKYLAEDLQIKC